MKRVIIANDHGALERKKIILDHLKSLGYEIEDCGVNTKESMDYPDKAREACSRFVNEGGYDFGILLCTTGIGISIAANKMPGIRCALPMNSWSAEMTRRHHKSNFIAFAGSDKVVYPQSISQILDSFIKGEFEGGRHQRRVDKIMNLEEK